MTDEELREIRERVDAAPSGKWWWEHCYECNPLRELSGDDFGEPEYIECAGKHFALVNEESRATGRVIDFRMVLLTAANDEGSLGPISTSPLHSFIAHARTDIPALLDEIDRLRKGEVREWREYRP